MQRTIKTINNKTDQESTSHIIIMKLAGKIFSEIPQRWSSQKKTIHNTFTSDFISVYLKLSLHFLLYQL